MPFAHKAEIYRDKSGEVIVFRLLLEQPFLAEEFEKSNYLRLRAADDNAYLIYPKETKFEQKHAEFFGRLRGDGTAALKLAYETVSENLDGSRRVQTRVGELSINIPAALDRDQGPPSIFLEWARRQNEHFVKLLRYYPEETFYQYALLQSRARYGVAPPPIPKTAATSQKVETGLYEAFSGSLAMQESLQRETLSTYPRTSGIPVQDMSEDEMQQGFVVFDLLFPSH